ncbi:MAG TPA: hypothetical protein PK668_19235 [Myxococcota bacterium]|nr:hypothetical protein [Myxococcota bacterium]HRY95135.1 hypothetical protein [Myxococcota bacterium]
MARENRLVALRCLLARLRGEPPPAPEHPPAVLSAPSVPLDAPEAAAPAAVPDARARRLQALRSMLARLGQAATAPEA